MTIPNPSSSSSRAGRSTEIEQMLIRHERLCMEDLPTASRYTDASRAIEPVTYRILVSREALLALYQELERENKTLGFVLAEQTERISSLKAKLQAIEDVAEGYVNTDDGDHANWVSIMGGMIDETQNRLQEATTEEPKP